MPRKSDPKPKNSDDKDEYKRFLETAKDAGASDDPKDFEKALKRVAPPRRGRSRG